MGRLPDDNPHGAPAGNLSHKSSTRIVYNVPNGYEICDGYDRCDMTNSGQYLVKKFWTFMRCRPDLLYDAHSAWFSIVVGLTLLIPPMRLPHSTAFGLIMISIGLNRQACILVSSQYRWHAASCLISFMSWIFFIATFIGHGRFAQACAFSTFAIASLLRYLQIEYHHLELTNSNPNSNANNPNAE